MKNTVVSSSITIVNESLSSLAATIRQGTWKPVSSPCLTIFNKSSYDAFHEDSSDLRWIISQLSTSIQVTFFLETEK